MVPARKMSSQFPLCETLDAERDTRRRFLKMNGDIPGGISGRSYQVMIKFFVRENNGGIGEEFVIFLCHHGLVLLNLLLSDLLLYLGLGKNKLYLLTGPPKRVEEANILVRKETQNKLFSLTQNLSVV